MPLSWWQEWFWAALICWTGASAYQATTGSAQDSGLNHFVTRPDIRAPKWNVYTHREDLLAPGHWFVCEFWRSICRPARYRIGCFNVAHADSHFKVAPYRILDAQDDGEGWSGPHIYDGTGELVWSGTGMYPGDFQDFRVSNVRGEDLMTVLVSDPRQIVIINDHYHVQEFKPLEALNMHELNFIENGTRALVLRGDVRLATREMTQSIGFDEECLVAFNILQELDVMNDWKPLFAWRSFDHVGLEESSHVDDPPPQRCSGDPWDYMHSNSIDKTGDGDYLLSARHTDTIYKISKETGDIVWRMGGMRSDFPMDGPWRFTRQHDVRYRGQNATHMFISILDNAKGEDLAPTSYEFSRGLLLAVDETNMAVSIEKQFDHPPTKDRYSQRRGNYQVLPNGNVFMGWSEQGVQSEYTSNGTLVMEAKFAVDWLGSYRQYKFEYSGGVSTEPLAVHAKAISTGAKSSSTLVHVSWNGAMNVQSYRLYEESAQDGMPVQLASVHKTGFETALISDGLSRRVFVEAVDEDGSVLATSDVFETMIDDDSVSVLVATFIAGNACSLAVMFVAWIVQRFGGMGGLWSGFGGLWSRRKARYHLLTSEKADHTAGAFSAKFDEEIDGLPSYEMQGHLEERQAP